MVPLKACRLKCKDPRIIARYNLALEQELTSQNLPSCMQELESQAKSYQLTRAQQLALEAINRETTCAKLLVECLCWKLTVSKVQWCPKLTNAIVCILYWKGIRKCIQNGRIVAQYLLQIVKKGGLSHHPEHFDLTEDQVLACTAWPPVSRIDCGTSTGDTEIEEIYLEMDPKHRTGQEQCLPDSSSNRQQQCKEGTEPHLGPQP